MQKTMPRVRAKRKTGNEFVESDSETLLGFWQWAYSDLLTNLTRSALAEYLVALDLGLAKGIRQEWASCDLVLMEKKTIRIEVKSSAYLQAWGQDRLSRIVFNISVAHGWNPNTNQMTKRRQRNSHVYVFCTLTHKDKRTVNPLDPKQWEFYVLPTKTINSRIPKQTTLTLGSLKTLNPIVAKFGEIREAIIASAGNGDVLGKYMSAKCL